MRAPFVFATVGLMIGLLVFHPRSAITRETDLDGMFCQPREEKGNLLKNTYNEVLVGFGLVTSSTAVLERRGQLLEIFEMTDPESGLDPGGISTTVLASWTIVLTRLEQVSGGDEMKVSCTITTGDYIRRRLGKWEGFLFVDGHKGARIVSLEIKDEGSWSLNIKDRRRSELSISGDCWTFLSSEELQKAKKANFYSRAPPY